MTIFSGGQSGADRAALDFAIEHDIAHGGWCPRGRVAEDGPISSRYALRETPLRRYAQRTEWNVRDSDATVVFTIAANVSGGSALTLVCARRLGKPALHLSRDSFVEMHGEDEAASAAAGQLSEFLSKHQVSTLNIAGPRGSQEPQIAAFIQRVLVAVFIES